MLVERVDGWRRLHPLTILREMGAMAWAIVAALAFDFDWEVRYPGIPDGVEADAVIAVVVFGYAVLRYLFTAYRLTEQTLDLRRGVVFKSSQSMPRDRVQTVAVTTGLIGRLAGVSTVEVSAADTKDITLAYVSSLNADRLRRILESRGATQIPDSEQVESVADREPIADLPPDRLILYALTDGGLLLGLMGLVAAGIISFLAGFILAPFAVAVMVGGWSAMRAVGLVGFRSWLRPDRVQVESGLLSRRETEAPLNRIQAIGVSRPLMRRLFGHETVEMTTGELSLGSESVAFTKGMLAPLVEIGTWRRISERVIGYVRLGEVDLRPSSRHAIRRSIVRGVVLTAAVVGLVTLPSLWWDLGWWLPTLLGVMGVVTAVLYGQARYRALGWAVDGEYLLVRHGVFDRRLAIVPIGKVQDVLVTETLFQRRLGLATVEVDTAGVAIPGSSLSSGVKAIDLTRDDARSLADHLMAAAARVALPDGV